MRFLHALGRHDALVVLAQDDVDVTPEPIEHDDRPEAEAHQDRQRRQQSDQNLGLECLHRAHPLVISMRLLCRSIIENCKCITRVVLHAKDRLLRRRSEVESILQFARSCHRLVADCKARVLGPGKRVVSYV